MADMMSAGVSDSESDFADSVYESAENLLELCNKQIKARGKLT
jgi:hypothetical protein